MRIRKRVKLRRGRSGRNQKEQFKRGEKIKQTRRQDGTQRSPRQGQRGQESVAKGQEVWRWLRPEVRVLPMPQGGGGLLRVPGVWTLLAEVSELRAMPENITSRGTRLSE